MKYFVRFGWVGFFFMGFGAGGTGCVIGAETQIQTGGSGGMEATPGGSGGDQTGTGGNVENGGSGGNGSQNQAGSGGSGGQEGNPLDVDR